MENLFQQRLDRARHLLKKEECLFLINEADIYYYTAFSGDSSYLFISQDEAIFITDGRYTEQIRQEKRIDLEILEISVDHPLSGILKDLAPRLKNQSILLNKQWVNLAVYELLLKSLGPDLSLKDDTITRDLRMVKHPLEIEIIRQNLITTELGFNLVLPSVKSGQTESELAAELEYILKKQGSQKPAFETIVASGARSALPHGVASPKKIVENEIILFDFGVFCNGYASDFTRCYYFGKIIDSKINEIQKVVKEAVWAAQEEVREGVLSSRVHQAAYDVIDKAGYASYFTHSTGHGVGLEIHEYPRISRNSDVELKAGMVFTIEPGIYLPGLGGIRLEDMVVVTRQGRDVLTTTGYDI